MYFSEKILAEVQVQVLASHERFISSIFLRTSKTGPFPPRSSRYISKQGVPRKEWRITAWNADFIRPRESAQDQSPILGLQSELVFPRDRALLYRDAGQVQVMR